MWSKSSEVDNNKPSVMQELGNGTPAIEVHSYRPTPTRKCFPLGRPTVLGQMLKLSASFAQPATDLAKQ